MSGSHWASIKGTPTSTIQIINRLLPSTRYTRAWLGWELAARKAVAVFDR